MSRKPKEDEKIEVLDTGDHEIELPPVDDAARAVLVADATKKPVADAPPAEDIPAVRRYVVVKGGSVLQNGFRTRMAEGKIVDSLNYDIAHLQRQGIRLQREESFTQDLVE